MHQQSEATRYARNLALIISFKIKILTLIPQSGMWEEPKVPGTVDLTVFGTSPLFNISDVKSHTNGYLDGSKTGYGLALKPIPSDDPNDPLNVGISSKLQRGHVLTVETSV